MSTEFKIGRLRYTWRGYWDTNVEYNRDAVVSYSGKTYVCLYPHTSTNFNADLTYYDSVEGSVPRWLLMIDGRAWKQAWEPETYYFFGNIVTYSGVVYICTDEHTSGVSQIDLTKWATYSQYDNWDSLWSPDSVYGIGDIVRYGGIVYRCVLDHVSAASDAIGLEADQSKWEVVNSGIEYNGVWQPETRYKSNDITKLGTDLYKCVSGHTSVTLFDQTKWELWIPGKELTGQWSASVIYQPGDVAVYGGYSYVSKSINNQNNIPTIAGADWDLVTQGYRSREPWDSASQYRIGDVVLRGGNLYSASADNSNQDPTTTVGSWTLIVPGSTWKSFWQSNVNYVIGEVVNWQTASYRCVETHLSSESSRPDKQATVGTPTVFWEVFAYHAKENATNTPGDIVFYKDGVPTAFPILPTTSNTGEAPGTTVDPNATNTFLLKVENGRPLWTKIFELPDVFYVTTTGTDDPTYGKTWDQAWKTVKYACEQVGKGFYFQNANTLLVKNKEFLVQEMYQWMLNQKANNFAPFTTTSTFDQEATIRDARYVVDALSHDIVRASNSRIVTATIAYFKENSKTTFFNTATDDARAFIVAALTRMRTVIESVLTNTDPAINYQNENILWTEGNSYNTGDVVYFDGAYFESLIDSNIDTLDVLESWQLMFETPTGIIPQYKDAGIVSETGAYTEITSLLDILINAITLASREALPRINTGASTTIYIKTGTYSEILPIVVPDNTSLVGDELRGTVIQPSLSVYTSTRYCSTLTNRFTFRSVTGLEPGMPIQFSASSVNDDFGGITLGQTYYVLSINGNDVDISETVNGTQVSLITGIGNMTVYAGDCLKDMFYMRNSTGLRNMTLTGLAGSLGAPNAFTTQRPTGGSYVSLDAGEGPDDTRTWIISRSPYMQNVTNFGVGCVGAKIDGRLHNGGFRSMVANDFTQILSDGIGVWCTGPNSLTELVSVFTYYNYAGYMAEDGGRIRATNGNSSYGVYGVIAEGYDDTEVPISGKVDNRSVQVQASVQSAFGTAAELLSLEYTNAGSNYYEETTNMLNYSNVFTSWSTDGNITIQKNTLSPSGDTDGWTLTATTSNVDASYIYQNISILPVGTQYSNLTALNVTGAGTDATFDITVGSTSYSAVVNTGGNNYVTGNELRIPGSLLGGADGANDCFLTVTSLVGSAVLGVSVSGTVPTNSNQGYTISLHAKRGTAQSFDISAIFSGNTVATTTMSYSFTSNEFTFTTDANGAAPKSYNKLELTDGWYRFSMTVYDKPALNNNLQVRIYPRGKSGLAGSTRFYGAQAQISESPTFYLETHTHQFTSNANFLVSGAGTGAFLLGDEIRSKAVFETRITDSGTGVGGRGYLVGSNNAQGGDDTYIILAGSDTNQETNYIGMRVFIQSGTGAGQYGYISAYDATASKIADILKESFEPLPIQSTDSGTSLFTLQAGANTETLYSDQLVQFIPTYYNTTATETGIDSMEVTTVIGGSTNTMTVSNTAKLTVNMPIKFSGEVFGGVTSMFTYYVKEIIDSTTFTISTEIYGNLWLLNSGTGSMTMSFAGYNSYIEASTTNMDINMPINFTGVSMGGIVVGTTYYIHEIVSPTKFTIATALVNTTVTQTAAGTNYLTTSSTTQLVPLNPIKFTGTVFGGITAGNNYYINKVVNGSNFTIAETLIETTASKTETLTNLITVTSTSGFIANNPIQFIGKTVGGVVNGTIYYILAINDGTTFTISATPGGSAVNLSSADCEVLVRTTPAAMVLSNATGSMSSTSTNNKLSLTAAYGSMNGTYSTSLFGNVTKGTTYYVKTVPNSNTFSVSTTPGGTAITLKSDTGSMNIAAVGWDHIHPGTAIETQLDNSSIYYVEPRIQYSKPEFSQALTTVNTAAVGTAWSSIAYGNNKFIALPNGNAIAGISNDGGQTWSPMALPTSQPWSGIAYGNGRWVAISTGDLVTATTIYSINDGEGWHMSAMPNPGNWSNLIYGNGKFISIKSSGTEVAYSTNYGKTWALGSGLPSGTWTGVTYGQGIFVAVSSSGTRAAYSLDGVSWDTSNLSTGAWAGVAYGNGLYIAIPAGGGQPARSNDGITWQLSPYTILAMDKITYGQGIFVATSASSGNAYTSRDGFTWEKQTINATASNAVAFGWNPTTNAGAFVTVGGTTSGSVISAGSIARGRINVTSSTVSTITMFEPGSNYTSTPTIKITDPNVTLPVSVSVRIGDGALANPTFINKGQDYNTNSTVVKITGGGYADQYQSGLRISVKNLTALPAPGDDLVIAGNSIVYKVTSAKIVYGTTAPNIMANIEVSPEITVAKAPVHEALVTIRTKYSQCRLTNHDFLNVGYGNLAQSNYPNLPQDTVLAPQDQAVEVNYGRVFYTSTDQDGNFKVGSLFGVEQATGIVTLSATQFGLTGLETLSLGGIAIGSQSVIIRQFSTDPTFIANSNNIVPTQRAIKAYLTSRLSQGGANTFTGQLTAGTVVVGGANKIRSTIPEGNAGWVVNFPVQARVQGQFAAWDGDGMALAHFMKSFHHRNGGFGR